MKNTVHDLLNQFETYLFSQNATSPLTIKNYKADIRQFIEWYEKKFERAFHPSSLSQQLIDIYKEERASGKYIQESLTPLTLRSFERHVSSLRKFCLFLLSSNLLESNPFAIQVTSKAEDPARLSEFKDFLYTRKLSDLTIKNYIIDIRGFLSWTEAVFKNEQQNTPYFLQPQIIEEYKNRLMHFSDLSPISINRKLSSLRKYSEWILKEPLYVPNVLHDKTAQTLKGLKTSDLLESVELQFVSPMQSKNISSDHNDTVVYSRFPPLRVAQKTRRGCQLLVTFFLSIFDTNITRPVASLLTLVQLESWKTHGKPLFYNIDGTKSLAKSPFALKNSRVANISKNLYFDQKLSPSKKWLNMFQKRPEYYKKYHSSQFEHHLYFSILVIIVLSLGYLIILKVDESKNKLQKNVLGTSYSKTFAFQGRLTDTNGAPITTPELVRFSLYTSLSSSGSAQIWQDVKKIIPHTDGSFFVILGGNNSSNTIPMVESLQDIWLGVTIGTNPELEPRAQLATASLAKNTKAVEGMMPITNPDSPTKNVLLALDSAGDLTIGGASNPTFQATGGIFTLSGESVVITTNRGSNQDIQFAPQGLGRVDIQKPIHNTSEYNTSSGVAGAVEIADSLFISASSSAESALIIKQNLSGNLISASSSDSAKFTVSNEGNGFFAGRLGIGIASPSATFEALSNAGDQFRLSYSKDEYATFFVNAAGDTSIDTTGKDITSVSRWTLGSTLPGKSLFTVQGAVPNQALMTINETGNQDILTASASGTTKFILDRTGSLTLASGAMIKPLSDSSSSLLITNASSKPLASFDTSNNRVGIGTTSPSQTLDVTGTVQVDLTGSPTINALCHSGTGTTDQDIVDCSGSPSDIAEWYPADFTVEPGDIVSTSKDIFVYSSEGSDPYTGVIRTLGQQTISVLKKAETEEKVIGVVSTGPNQIIGEDVKNAIDKQKPKNIRPVPLALSGRVPVKVSTENGAIEEGDFLTLSSTPGAAAKAINPGFVIGQALESFNPNVSKCLLQINPNNTNYTSSKFGSIRTNNSDQFVCYDTVLILIKPFWYDPTATLAEDGSFLFVKQPNSSEFGLVKNLGNDATTIAENIQRLPENSIRKIAGFSKAFVANLQAGSINAQEIATDTLSITSSNVTIAGKTLTTYVNEGVQTSLQAIDSLRAEKVITPLAQVQNIQTDLISPLSGDTIVADGKLVIRHSGLPADRQGLSRIDSGVASQSSSPQNDILFEVQNSNQTAVASIDATGNATLSGHLTSASLETLSASVSGILTTDKLVARDVDFSNQTLEKLQRLVGSSSASTTQLLTSSPSAASSALFIDAPFAKFSEGLIALGPTSLTNLSVSGQLSVSTQLILSDNSINALGSNLEIQPLKQGAVSFMSGLVKITTDGNLEVQGNAVFAHDVRIDGIFSPSIISPIPGTDLIVRLGALPEQSQKLVVQNASNETVLTIDTKGNLTSSASATFKEMVTNALQIVRSAQADTSLTETIATASAGTATIITGEKERTIISPFITEKSLIYISPASDTKGNVPYIARQKSPNEDTHELGSFTIQIPNRALEDIIVNWWVVN